MKRILVELDEYYLDVKNNYFKILKKQNGVYDSHKILVERPSDRNLI